jgi:hypothetical protein
MARVSFEGVQLDSRTRYMFVRLRWKLGLPLVITQGSYSGGVSASAGTHNGGGALDIRASNLTAEQRQRVVLMARQMGFAAWLRTPAQSDWPYHIHGIAIGTPDLHPSASAQVVDYKAGRNGLANNGPDDGPDGYRSMTWEKYEQAHPDEEFWMINGEDVLRRIGVLEARVTDNTNARAQYAYTSVTTGNVADRLAVLEGRVTDNTDARAQYAYASVTGEGATVEAITDLRAEVAALKAQVAALPKA